MEQRATTKLARGGRLACHVCTRLASCANNEAGHHHRKCARRGSADYAHEWPLKATGDRRIKRGRKRNEREEDDARSNRSLRRKKMDIVSASEEEEKNERPRRLAKQARKFETTRLASVHTRPNKFFAAERKGCPPLRDSKAA